MGRGLDRMSRGMDTKFTVHIAKGNLRPEAPMQAAKLASEAGIILRDHIPILPHWKSYKKDEALVTNYIGKIAVSIQHVLSRVIIRIFLSCLFSAALVLYTI